MRPCGLLFAGPNRIGSTADRGETWSEIAWAVTLIEARCGPFNCGMPIADLGFVKLLTICERGPGRRLANTRTRVSVNLFLLPTESKTTGSWYLRTSRRAFRSSFQND